MGTQFVTLPLKTGNQQKELLFAAAQCAGAHVEVEAAAELPLDPSDRGARLELFLTRITSTRELLEKAMAQLDIDL